jgi:hypothetical protein
LINKQKLIIVISTRVTFGQISKITQLEWFEEAFPEQWSHPPESHSRKKRRIRIFVGNILLWRWIAWFWCYQFYILFFCHKMREKVVNYLLLTIKNIICCSFFLMQTKKDILFSSFSSTIIMHLRSSTINIFLWLSSFYSLPRIFLNINFLP